MLDLLQYNLGLNSAFDDDGNNAATLTSIEGVLEAVPDDESFEGGDGVVNEVSSQLHCLNPSLLHNV